jgi:signal transduction histidine kinase
MSAPPVSRFRGGLKWLTGGLVVAALIALLVFLAVKSRNTVPQARADLIASLLRLREINARLDVDILRSRNGLNSDYDPLQEGLLATQEVRAQLEADLAQVGIPEPEALSTLYASLEQKFAGIDDFKAANAIWLNSLRYLPTLVESIEHDPKADVALRLQANEIAAWLFRSGLLRDMDPAAIRQTLAAITSRAQALPPETELAQALQGLRVHSETILRQNEREAELLAELAEIPVASGIGQLQEALEGAFDAQTTRADFFRNLLTTYSAFLLLFLFYIGARLAASYRQLDRANRALNEANESLETRVEERTRDLNAALAELKASEAHLIQSEKMASLGQMVAGVAHEINTPLGYVRGTAEFLVQALADTLTPYCQRANAFIASVTNPAAPATAQPEAPAPLDADLLPELKTALDNSLYGLDQIGEIVLNLKNFSRLDRGQHTRYQLEEGIDSALMLAKNLVKHRKVHKHYARTRPVLCAPSQINQVLLNLITNAAQATADEDGAITISTRMRGDDHVVIKIADNGTGIPEEVIEHIFDPFFTTKEIGKGTGLGLSIAYKIITQHQGRIRVFSKPGKGALFSIELPVEGRAQEEKPVQAEEEPLLLEDD